MRPRWSSRRSWQNQTAATRLRLRITAAPGHDAETWWFGEGVSRYLAMVGLAAYHAAGTRPASAKHQSSGGSDWPALNRWAATGEAAADLGEPVPGLAEPPPARAEAVPRCLLSTTTRPSASSSPVT